MLPSGVIKALPAKYHQVIENLPSNFCVEEIRLRIGWPVHLVGQGDLFMDHQKISPSPHQLDRVSRQELEEIIQRVNQYSPYAFTEEIREGYITLPGGHRVGFCGRTVTEQGVVKTIRDFSSLNFRVMRELKGTGEKVLPYLCKGSSIYNTLILSPPRCGKTTLLRDLIRLLSYGGREGRGIKVGVVDERSEIGGCYLGEPQLDLGPRADILDGCPKARGIMLLLRAMSPQVIATDEIGRKEDMIALREALNAGVKVLATIHGNSFQDLKHRPGLEKIIAGGFFERTILLSSRSGPGTIEGIFNQEGFLLYPGSELN